MSYLVDTNVISELVKKKPEKNVIDWFKTIPNEALHISVLTLGEIRKGVENLQNGERKEKLLLWLEIELPNWFEDRVLAIDQNVADMWGRLLGEIKHSVPAIDSLIAATAIQHNLRLVTRNEKDFQHYPVKLVNPW